jgi:hypothetical protein
VLLGDFAQRRLLGDAGVGHDHVHLTLGTPDGVGDAVEVLNTWTRPPGWRRRGADELHRLVERFLAPTEDEHVGALLHEPLGDGEPDAAVAAADDRDLACQSRGQRYYDRAKPLVDEMDDVDNEMTNSTLSVSGLVRISVASTFGRLHILPLIP